MALELRQQLKLSQQLVMTPQLQQAIKLLQLSRVELLETVQQELLENPFLEEAPANEPVAPQDQEEPRHEKPQDEVYDEDLSRNADWEEYLGEFASTPRTSQGRELEIAEEISPLEARYSAKPTLEGHLLWQLHLSTLTDEQKEIGEIIIGNLGSSGYLRASVEEIAEMASTTPEAVQTVLERVQLFDPVGVAARDARECLLVQLKSLRYDRDPILLELVQSHLEDLEAHRYKPLLRKFKLDMEGLREYLDIIQSLEPLPGASFDGSEPTYVSPDVFVYSVGDEFVILLNEDGLPHLQLSSMLRDGVPSCNEKEKDYVSEKVRSASWLIRSLYQRQRTLYKVVESIVKHQQPFFRDGVTKLAPLILKDIADRTGLDVSTISRVVNSKYVQTQFGIILLKSLFSEAMQTASGGEVSSYEIKNILRSCIDDEDKRRPLTDETLMDILNDKGYCIARRTVAKYREMLGIPVARLRKQI